MIKVRILNKQPYWQNYEYDAFHAFEDFCNANDIRTKSYKNGNTDYWFKKTDYKYGRYLIRKMQITNVMIEVTGKV